MTRSMGRGVCQASRGGKHGDGRPRGGKSPKEDRAATRGESRRERLLPRLVPDRWQLRARLHHPDRHRAGQRQRQDHHRPARHPGGCPGRLIQPRTTAAPRAPRLTRPGGAFVRSEDAPGTVVSERRSRSGRACGHRSNDGRCEPLSPRWTPPRQPRNDVAAGRRSATTTGASSPAAASTSTGKGRGQSCGRSPKGPERASARSRTGSRQRATSGVRRTTIRLR
jgi:hypothetical protein